MRTGRDVYRAPDETYTRRWIFHLYPLCACCSAKLSISTTRRVRPGTVDNDDIARSITVPALFSPGLALLMVTPLTLSCSLSLRGWCTLYNLH